MRYQEFYSELGKLLYAVAHVDGVITPQEKEALKKMVKEELVPNEKHKDSFGTDAAYYTEMEFDYLEEEMGDTQAAFESFIDYVEEHHTAFDEKMKKVCLRVAEELARAYHQVNRKEKNLLEKLKQRLQKIETKK